MSSRVLSLFGLKRALGLCPEVALMLMRLPILLRGNILPLVQWTSTAKLALFPSQGGKKWKSFEEQKRNVIKFGNRFCEISSFFSFDRIWLLIGGYRIESFGVERKILNDPQPARKERNCGHFHVTLPRNGKKRNRLCSIFSDGGFSLFLSAKKNWDQKGPPRRREKSPCRGPRKNGTFLIISS